VDRHCKGLHQRAQQVPEAELWELERGAPWRRVLGLAVRLVFGLKGGVGVERLSEFFHRVRLERYLAVSPTALRSLRTPMETVILAYQAEHERRLGQAGHRLERIAGADETFFDQVVVVATCNRKPANLQSTPFSDRNYLQLTGAQTDIICN
jgi:hypothetical protein